MRTSAERLALVRRVIEHVSHIGVRASTGMIADENYTVLLDLRDLEYELHKDMSAEEAAEREKERG